MGKTPRNPKRPRKDKEEESEDLEELMDLELQDKPKRKTASVYGYITGFVTKSENGKAQLVECHKCIVAAVKSKLDEDDNDDEDDENETEKKKAQT